MEIGTILKEAREEKGLTLGDIQDITKIQKRYLAAIEQHDFHALPGRFYARAFIKEYAQAVGLDPAVVLEGFDEEKIDIDEEESVQYTRLDSAKGSREDKKSFILASLPSVIVIILIIGIILVAWALYQKTLTTSDLNTEEPSENDEIIRKVEDEQSEKEKADKEKEKAKKKEQDEKKAKEKKEKEKNKDKEAFSVVEVGDGPSPLSTLEYQYEGDKVEITFDVTDAAYVEVKGESGEVYLVDTVNKDSDLKGIDVSKEKRVYLNIGNASGLAVSINGAELAYPVDEKDYVHQKLWVNLIQK